MTDDAHGIGVVGGGRGSSFVGNAHVPVPLQMGTLSKAIGAYGGYLCASAPVIDLMRNRARTFVYSTGLPPSVVAAAIAALDIIEREPAYAALPVQKARPFTAPPRTAAGAEPDRADHHRCGRGGAGRSAPAAKPKDILVVADPAADGARRAPRGCASPSPRSIPTTRSIALADLVRDTILA